MLRKPITIIFLACLLQNAAAQYRCHNPNGNSGYRVSIRECDSLMEVLKKKPLTSGDRQFLESSQCLDGYGLPPYVCCTADQSFTNTNALPPSKMLSRLTNAVPRSGNILPEPTACGAPSLGSRIYNGNAMALDEYPWMVLLEHINKRGERVLKCGGSLINQRYVLTARHCVIGTYGTLSRVRLGEYDITKEIDCIAGYCNDRVVELGIEDIIPYPTSNSHHHDIALIRLDADVSYSSFIRPVCLPLTSTRLSINVGDNLVVAGWGRTLLERQSNVKLKLVVPLNDHNTCARKFATRSVNLIPSQLCAGGEFAKDSCKGDSGGPLMRMNSQNRWCLVGIVSFGYLCGLEHWPGVYTSLADYVPWILQTMKL